MKALFRFALLFCLVCGLNTAAHAWPGAGNSFSLHGTLDGDADMQAGSLFESNGEYSMIGYCFFDADQDGVRDDGELPIPGVAVSLKRINFWLQAIEEQTATTDAQGLYAFNGLAGGLYLVSADHSGGFSTSFNPALGIVGFLRPEAVIHFGMYGQEPAEPAEPSVAISADPAVIEKGGSSALQWTSSNAVSVTIDQGIGAVDLAGARTVSPAATTLYTITAEDALGQTAQDSVTVVVLDDAAIQPVPDDDSTPEPTVLLSANPPTVDKGGTSMLVWSSSHATSAAINPDIGAVKVTGTYELKNIKKTTSYIITVSGPGGQAMAQATIVVAATDSSSGGGSGSSADTLARLVNAVSTGNGSVRVSFSASMSDDAANPSNYNIVHEGPEGSGSHLTVTGAQFASGTNRTMVDVFTMPQSEIVYKLTVVARDSSGKPLAPKGLVAGVLVDPSSAAFLGTPPEDSDLVDTDGDGLSDAAEQAGWSVFVTLSGGQIVSRHVTSDPLNRDTDSDTIPDNAEKYFGIDPRSRDTDGDTLGDDLELNRIYSSPVAQDTDGDSLMDGLEFTFFRTSPLIADTDGDQFSDDEELLDLDRDPLIADLPRPQIMIGDVRLSLDVRSSYTDETGQEQSVEDTLQATISKGSEQRFSTSDTISNETVLQHGEKIGREVSYGIKDGFGAKGSFESSFGQTYTNGYTSTRNQESASTLTSAYQNTISHAFTQSQNRSVTRTIENAQIVADVSIKNTSDIAFTITNIEISVLRQDRRNSYRFTPIASLRTSGADDPNEQPAFNLGPFDPERGPFIFESTGSYPNLVEELMREPQGLVYRVVNFDILDEFGRNFVFSSQEVNDRTAGITIDYGEGEVESYRVATHNIFDDSGAMQPISMQKALEIIGITKSPSPTGDTPGADPDNATIQATYGTQVTADGVEILTRVRGTQADLVSPDPDKRFWAVISSNRSVPPTIGFSTIDLRARDNFLLVFTRDRDRDGLLEHEEVFYGSSDIDNDTDGDGLGDFFEVRTGWSVALKGTGVYKVFSSPASSDSDFDGLRDNEELAFGTDPARPDTDFDGLNDIDEIYGPIEIVLFDGDLDELNNPVLFVPRYVGAPSIVNGFDGLCDTAATGDDEQLVQPGATAADGEVLIAAGPNQEVDTTLDILGDDYIRVAHDQEYLTDPLYRDTDRDSMTDGREVIVGVNPNRDDAGIVVDNDNDGLSDSEERMGWTIIVNQNGINDPFIKVVTSDPFRADTDRDGIPDVFERAIGTNPRVRDTDNDSLLDWYEFDVNDIFRYNVNALADARLRCDDATGCLYTPPESHQLIGSDPREADSDADGLADLEEIAFGSDPNDQDADGDGMDELGEYGAGTDPNAPDNDLDGVNDFIEVTRGTDPLIKDKLVLFELLYIYCDDADDEGAPPLDCIEVYGNWVVSVGTVNYIAYPLSNVEFCDGDTHSINRSASITLKEGETISLTTNNVYEDDNSGDDAFSNLSVNIGYATVASGTFSNQISGDDGELTTFHRITVIDGLP